MPSSRAFSGAQDEGKDLSDPAYGGGGYGKHKRPDLSNTSFLIDALRAAGNDANSEAIQRALIFVSRCQNLESEHNTTPFSAKNPDGGFYYTAAAGGSSQAGETAEGGLRSYASMTYAGLKSMIYAGVGPDDPRVKAAVDWIRKNYDLKTNPGMGDSGLYYYYHVFAKALDAMGRDEFTDAAGRKHNWRSRTDSTSCGAATRRRFLGKREFAMAGRRCKPGDVVRIACAELLPTLSTTAQPHFGISNIAARQL